MTPRRIVSCLVVALLIMISAGQSAGATTPLSVQTSKQQVAVRHATATVAAAGASNPCGGSAYACADGTFDAWNGHNGSRCEWVGNAPTLGSCTNNDYLVANFGYGCSGCDHIKLFWGANYTGAYFCLPPGYVYGQPTSPGLKFNHTGYNGDRRGLGQSIWYNAASARWTGPC